MVLSGKAVPYLEQGLEDWRSFCKIRGFKRQPYSSFPSFRCRSDIVTDSMSTPSALTEVALRWVKSSQNSSALGPVIMIVPVPYCRNRLLCSGTKGPKISACHRNPEEARSSVM